MFIDEARRDPRQYLVLLSPQAGRSLELRTLTREVMAQLARRVDRDLVWLRAAHSNTGQPHTHTILQGRDRAGEPVVIDQAYLRGGELKGDAERIATGLFGALIGVLAHGRDEARGRFLEPEVGSLRLWTPGHRGQFEWGFERER